MSTTESSQVQHNFIPQALQAASEAQLARVEAFFAQVSEMETKAMEQTRTAIEESARLSRESLAYQASLAAEWRKGSLEAMRRTAQLWTSFPFGGA